MPIILIVLAVSILVGTASNKVKPYWSPLLVASLCCACVLSLAWGFLDLRGGYTAIVLTLVNAAGEFLSPLIVFVMVPFLIGRYLPRVIFRVTGGRLFRGLIQGGERIDVGR